MVNAENLVAVWASRAGYWRASDVRQCAGQSQCRKAETPLLDGERGDGHSREASRLSTESGRDVLNACAGREMGTLSLSLVGITVDMVGA